MSLINDALKRASQSDKNRPTPTALPRLMQPVAEAPRERNSWLLGAIAAAVVGLVVAVWFFWKSLAAGQLGQAAIAEPSRPGPNPPQIVQKSSPPAVPAPAVVAAPAPAPAPDPDAWLTNLTLKAIFYSKTNPRALVNGTMVETGDKIDGVLITGILSDRIFVDWNGQTRELKMGRQ